MHVIVIGSVNLDLSAQVKRLPKPGETVSGGKLQRFPGGKGGNQALAARRLGADVTLVASVGQDEAATQALALLEAGGVNLDRVIRHVDVPTGLAMIAVAPSGENQIVVAPGANGLIEEADFEGLTADLMICQLEVPADVIAAAAETFTGFFCVNLAPAKEIDVAVLQRADVVVVNEVESDWYGATLSACRGLVATTFGAAGAMLEKDGETIARCSSPRIIAVDTVGSGDSFTAALAVALCEGQAPQEALEFACAAGAVAATRRGAQPSLPHRQEVEDLLQTKGSR